MINKSSKKQRNKKSVQEEGMDSLFSKMERSIKFYYKIDTLPKCVDKDWFDKTIHLQIYFRNKLYPESPFRI